MKSRSEIIENICFIAVGSDYTDKQKSDASNLLEKFTTNQISIEDAEKLYSEIVSNGTKGGYWINKYKTKVVYQSLKKYQLHQLSKYEILKLISSLITHSIIELELNDTVTEEELGINELINILSYTLNNEIDYDKIDSVLYKYGYLNKMEGDRTDGECSKN